MKMKQHEINNQHRELKKDIDAVLQKHKNLSDVEILAIISQMVGMIIALSDQRKLTPEQALAIVSSNLEIGNQIVIDDLQKTRGNA